MEGVGRRWESVAAVALAVLGAVVLVLGLTRAPDRPPAPPGPSARSEHHAGSSAGPEPRESGVPVRDQLRGPVLPSSPPVLLRVARLDLRRPLVRLGVDGAGALQPPSRPEDVGWFVGSVTPGEVGPAVLAGHVTWNGSPAVFHRLGTMRRGDRVQVDRADGSVAVFTVTGVRRYAKSGFPTDLVYGPADRAVLRLITCGGRYDAQRHRYDDNVVVFARLVAVR